MPPVAHTTAPKGVDRSVVHDAQHPRPHASSPSVVTRSAAPNGQTGFLGDVVGGRAAATDAIGKRERRVGVALEDHLEGIRALTATSSISSSSASQRRRSLDCAALWRGRDID
jgi:hypothetical protein